jgi:hypothetical protein
LAATCAASCATSSTPSLPYAFFCVTSHGSPEPSPEQGGKGQGSGCGADGLGCRDKGSVTGRRTARVKPRGGRCCGRTP